MTPLPRLCRLRRLEHRGIVDCGGLVIDRTLRGEDEARRRVVAEWRDGVVVRPTPLGYLLRFPGPRRVRVAEAPGIPLVARRQAFGEVLTGAPLADDECDAMSAPAGAVIVARGGEAVLLDASAAPIDPAQWLDLEAWRVVAVVALAPPPPAPRVAEEAVERTAGVILVPTLVEGGRPAPSVALAEALKQEPQAGGPYRSKPHVAVDALRAVLVAVAHLVARASARRAPGAPAEARGQGASDAESEPRGGVVRRLQQWLTRLALQTRLGRWLGTAHARYLGELFEMFERGDLDAALRHAIPLGGESSGDAASLSRLRPRSELQIGNRATPASGTLYTATDVFDELRRRYRAAVDRLERDGRIDEAAFVLAELLHAEEEAVAFLERHGRLGKAAELAEGRGLAPALVVRQWHLAGEYGRAVRIARRHGCFEDAIVRLERSQKDEQAASLRLAWGESLAADGDYAGAADAVWPAKPVVSLTSRARELVSGWIDLAIEGGGIGGSRMLARKIGLGLGVESEIVARAAALLAEEGTEGRIQRVRFAEALVAGAPGALGPPIARATARALFADSEETDRDLEPIVRAVIELSGDAGLRVDRPRLTRRTLRLDAYRHVIVAEDRGSRPIHDAVALPHRRALLALGDLGVALVDGRCRVLARFDHPADELVASDHGTRAIAVLTRGGVSRFSRIDLVTRRSGTWGELELLDHASTFDGSSWIVIRAGVRERNLVALDATVDGLEILAATELPGDDPRILGRGPTRVIATASWTGLQMIHRYDLPTWTLRGRHATRAPDQAIGTASPAGDIAQVGAGEGELAPTLWLEGRSIRIGIHAGEVPLELCAGSAFNVVLLRATGHLRVLILVSPSCMPRGEIVLEGASSGTIRIDEGALTLADDLGRLLVVDLLSGRIERDLRI